MATGLTNITGVTSRTEAPYPSIQSATLGHMPGSYDSLVVSCVTTVLLCSLSSNGEDLGLPFLCAVPWGSFGFNGKVQ